MLHCYIHCHPHLRNTHSFPTRRSSDLEAIIFLNQVGERLNDTLPELQSLHNDILQILLETESSSDLISHAQMQSWRAERIARNVDKMLRGDADAQIAAALLYPDANIYGRLLVAMPHGAVVVRIDR